MNKHELLRERAMCGWWIALNAAFLAAMIGIYLPSVKLAIANFDLFVHFFGGWQTLLVGLVTVTTLFFVPFIMWKEIQLYRQLSKQIRELGPSKISYV